MSIIKKYVVLIFALAFFALPAHAAEKNSKDSAWSFAIEEWFSRADAGWQISFPSTTTFGDQGRTESELSFKKIDSRITILRGRRTLNSNWSLDMGIGFGAIHGGRGTDTDRDISPTFGVDVWSESKQDISGDVMLFEVNFYHLLKQSEAETASWSTIFGFLHYQDKLHITNGVQTIPAFGPFAGLDSTYDFYWTALKIGTLYEWNSLKRLSLNGSLSLYPVTVYYGEGFWNLRAGTSFRTAAPSFTHLSLGYGFEAKLGLTFLITKRVTFGAGYRYLHLMAKDGTYTVYPYNGPKATADLDWAKVTRHGAYAQFLFRF